MYRHVGSTSGFLRMHPAIDLKEMGVPLPPPSVLTNSVTNSQSGSSSALTDTPQDPPQPADNNATAFRDGEDLGIGIEHFAYPCVYSTYTGNLYAGSEAVAFQGTLFFLERKFLLNWQDVLHVQKTEQLGVITVVTRDDIGYRFGSVQHPERVWSQLLSLHNSALLDHMKKSSCFSPTAQDASPPTASGNQRSLVARRSLRRMNSDPLQARVNTMADDSDNPSTQILTPSQAYLENSKTINHQPLTASATPKHTDKYSRASSVPVRDTAQREAMDNIAQEQLEESWAKLCEKAESSFQDVAIKDHELECNLDAFFDLFLADDAKFSIPNFMTNNGDTEMQSSPWKPTEDGQSHCRTVEYSHPVNAPLAPPRARARKEQCYQKYGPHGLSLVTDTYVEDVPMTDCFFVHDRIRVQPKGPSAVTLHFEFDIRFVKSTMFKAIIARTTRLEFKKFGQNMAEFMSQALTAPAELSMTGETTMATTSSADSGMPQTSTGDATTVKQPPLLPSISTVPNWTLVLVVVVVMLHLRLMLDMRLMRRSVMELETAVLNLNHKLSTSTIPPPSSLQ